MATMTSNLQLNKNEWEEIPNLGTYLALQLPSDGSIKVHMTDGSVPADEDDTGLIMGRSQGVLPGLLGMGGLPEGTRVFLRSFRDATETVTYLTY